ncbi:MAG TPA: CHAT domain-containing protein, partial [Anaerolineales bacterium]|nr:CHAT domain-containing protein [Anaerolineales bacterium]
MERAKAENSLMVVVSQETEGVFPLQATFYPAGGHPTHAGGNMLMTEELMRALRQAEYEPRLYGELLGRALFTGELMRLYVQARAQSQQRLRVLLELRDLSLYAFHWERLCAPLDDDQHWEMLCLQQRTPYAVQLPSPVLRNVTPRKAWNELRALVAIARPENLSEYDLADFQAEEAASLLGDALGGIEIDWLGAVPAGGGPASLERLRARLTEQRYNLLHIVAHGALLEKIKDTVLYLEREDRQVEAVSGDKLIAKLKEIGADNLPEFVFLTSCQSGKVNATEQLAGLAQRLVGEAGIPAVLAMTENISIQAAAAFTPPFYARLQAHGELDRALVEARAGLEGGDLSVPALYCR